MTIPARTGAIASAAALLACAAVAGLWASPATADAPVCLDSTRIEQTTVKGPQTIDFKMRDGTVWRNTLKQPCPDLKWWGFTYVLRGPNIVCGGEQSIRVIRTGQVCMLGQFTRLTPPRNDSQPHT